MRLIIYITSVVVLFASCRKVIEVDLNEVETKTVIEAELKEGINDFSVNISKTISYFTDESIPQIKGAIVTITDASGIKTSLIDNNDGSYLAPIFEAIPNQKFLLNVELPSGEIFEATSFLPNVVPLKTIKLEYQEGSLFFEEGYEPYTVFNDPLDETNYYRIILTKNGERGDSLEEVILLDDKFTNGNEIEFPLFSERLQLGDEIGIELISLDKDTYDYYETLISIAAASGGGGDSAAPANPTTNLNNNALGYFGAVSSSSKTAIVQ